MIKILGLDVATKTGYCVLYNEDLIDYGIINLQDRVNAEIKKKTSDKDEQNLILKRRRYKQLRTEIKSIIVEYRPNLIVLESVYHGHNVKTTASLQQLRGVALEAIPINIRTVSVNASSARSLVIPSNYAFNKKLKNYASSNDFPKESIGKMEAFNWAVSEYGLKDFNYSENNDITDAIVLASWCYMQYNDNYEYTNP